MTGHASDSASRGAEASAPIEGPAEHLLSPQARERMLPLPVAFQTFGLLFGEGAAVGLFCWAMLAADVMPYATDNQVPIQSRRILLASMIGCGAFSAFSGLMFLLRARAEPALRLQRLALRFSPLWFLGLLPFLFRWRLWAARELTFGVLVCVAGFALHASILASLQAGAQGSRWRLYAAFERAAQRRLERMRGWAPALLVGLGVLGYAVYFSYHTIQHHHSLQTASFDLGLEDNLVWNVVHGGPFQKMSPAFGPKGSHFGFHATFFSYVIALFYVWYQRAETLLVFQATTIALAAIPLYLFASRHIGRWSACLVALAYLLYPPVHGSNLYDFHYLPLGVFFLWLTLYLVDAGHDKWAAVAVILTLSVREDVAGDLVIIGAYLMFASRRPRAGAVVAGVAAAYFLALKMVVMPHFTQGNESFIHQWAGLIPDGGHGYAGVLMTVLGNPVYTMTSLLESEKFLYLVQIAAPFAFFAWRRPIGFLASLPGFFFTLLSTHYLPLVQISFQYTAHWTAFLFLALVSNLEWLRRPQCPGDTQGWLRQRAWLVTICVMTLITSFQYGAILQRNTAKGGFGPYRFEITDTDRDNYRKLTSLIRKVPPNAKIVSSEMIVPHVSNRSDSYTLRVGIFDADWLLFQAPNGEPEHSTSRQALETNFGVVSVAWPFVLAKRNYPKHENASVLRRMR